MIDENGQLQVGWSALIAIWRNWPGEHWLREHWKARFGSLPMVNRAMSLTYKLLARALYRWNRARHRW